LTKIFVGHGDDHDDYVMSFALAIDAAEEYRPRVASRR
jgi:hypothetical protein